MKLEELKNKINEMYEKYGDIEVCFDFKTTENMYYSFSKNGDYVHYDPENDFDSLFIEEILDIEETYADIEMTEVSGIVLTNYKSEELEAKQ